VSPWIEIDQSRIDMFADATGDHQWIHVDPERAKNGPFGETMPIAASPGTAHPLRPASAAQAANG
jgi:acyl dehydratase